VLSSRRQCVWKSFVQPRNERRQSPKVDMPAQLQLPYIRVVRQPLGRFQKRLGARCLASRTPCLSKASNVWQSEMHPYSKEAVSQQCKAVFALQSCAAASLPVSRSLLKGGNEHRRIYLQALQCTLPGERACLGNTQPLRSAGRHGERPASEGRCSRVEPLPPRDNTHTSSPSIIVKSVHSQPHSVVSA